MRKKLSLLTYASKDVLQFCQTFFKFYILYHSIPTSDIYVIEHNALSHIRMCVRDYPVNIIKMTTNYTSYKVKPRVQKLQQLQHSLLKQYEHVLIADLDEWFLPDPTLYKNLYDYLEKNNFEEFVAPIGYEILPEDNVINWNLPILQQRIKMGRLCGMDKPTLTRIPLKYTFATHAVSKFSAFHCGSNKKYSRFDLFNLHMKCVDLSVYNNMLLDTNRPGKNISQYITKRCIRKQLQTLNIPEKLKVF